LWYHLRWPLLIVLFRLKLLDTKYLSRAYLGAFTVVINKMATEDSLAKKDGTKILLLLYLYLLQGILGFSAIIPLLLTESSVSYSDQGIFRLASWIFLFKLVWAPIVDSVFVKRFGRRKSWLIPIQLLIGLFLLGFSSSTKFLVESGTNIVFLTFIFFALNFLAATQEICIDGWAITMLSE